MTPPLLCSCGKRYWPKQAWMHDRCAINGEYIAPFEVVVQVGLATNTATNEVANATNQSRAVRDAECDGGPVVSPDQKPHHEKVSKVEPTPTKEDGCRTSEDGGLASSLGRTPNRRDRGAYNAYQREYMKRWRASQTS